MHAWVITLLLVRPCVIMFIKIYKQSRMSARMSKCLYKHKVKQWFSCFSLLQVAAVIGIGLVYQGTGHRHNAEVLLSEIGVCLSVFEFWYKLQTDGAHTVTVLYFLEHLVS